MKTYLFETEQFLPIDIDTAWRFFSSAGNLSKITPPAMRLKIVSGPGPEEIHKGMLIRYHLKPLFNIPVKWTTEISEVDKPYSFADRQLTGPYRLWVHTHRFYEKKNGILMKDEVRYALPFGWAGDLAHILLVKRKIRHIFDYRRQVLEQIFPERSLSSA